jgi:hypothetical protein
MLDVVNKDHIANESSSAMRRNFSDVECSVAVLSATESPQGTAFSE